MSSLLAHDTGTGSPPDRGDPRTVRLLTPDGVRQTSGEYAARVADLDDAALLGLYTDMVVIRRIDQEATALQRQGELALWPPLLGQEAAQIGSARALEHDDFVFSSYREHGVAWVRGATTAELCRVWRGIAVAGWDPYRIGMATPQVIIGAQTLHATGYAIGAKYDGAASAVVSYFGDGATSEGDTSEAMVFAVTYGAPVVFFCQNNQWAISEPVGLQAPTGIAARAAGFGLPSVTVDGNDVLAVLAVTREALERARAGEGPSFIEAVTYRMGPHTTADDPTRYRTADEVEAWKAKDPVARLAAYLRGTGALTDDVDAEVAATAQRAAAALRADCTALGEPDGESIFDDVYAEPHPVLEAQRTRFLAYREGFEEER
ncbi:pyruvate dehydrogenase (acetyl-transferring) E1 component subunit alpha [Amnibacterium sp. CER49]|uniref:pyruvate dehydrogenase (acetyl-transferring) E1 component subunit alpha n=1 Tax=Amnibacterium sp. CER49 TaxID=3039161 RepID=UPI0024483CF7|nr:pyruvate dehydrogenase (acetyl-transferring) E1 component subunit alpha [Amnibacterium sp. CER49]MDH2445198.1 pyruvate dehydrogenase (acetyl-transferring) E1 component subunit alpha [Amnibacterium sp. CER49]